MKMKLKKVKHKLRGTQVLPVWKQFIENIKKDPGPINKQDC